MTRARDLADLAGAADAGTVAGKSLIINGDMAVAQRGTSFTAPSTSTYTLDRWAVMHSNDGVVDVSQSTTAPPNFKYSLKLDVTTADTSLASGNYQIFYHRIEGQNLAHLNYGSSDAKQLTMSFWVRSNKTGTYHVELQTAGSQELSRQYTIDTADTWEYKTLTWIANTDHTISEDNTTGLNVYWWLASGSTYDGSPIATTWANNTNRLSGQTNFLDSTSNEFYITGVKLEVGTTATPFQHESYAENLAKCQRYFYRITGNTSGNIGDGGIFVCNNWSSGTFFATGYHPEEMRSAPSFSYGAALNDFTVLEGTSIAAPTSISINGGNTRRFEMNFGTSSFGTAGNAAWVRISDNTNGYLQFDAEL